MTKERAIEITEELDELRKFCLVTHGDSTSYQICKLLKEIVADMIPEEQ